MLTMAASSVDGARFARFRVASAGGSFIQRASRAPACRLANAAWLPNAALAPLLCDLSQQTAAKSVPGAIVWRGIDTYFGFTNKDKGAEERRSGCAGRWDG
jgi:hypothetical protein